VDFITGLEVLLATFSSPNSIYFVKSMIYINLLLGIIIYVKLIFIIHFRLFLVFYVSFLYLFLIYLN